MALNTSGPISLGGSTVGQSIALELGLSATGSISLNATDVRELAGVAAGAITMPGDFWGKSAANRNNGIFGFGVSSSTYRNLTNSVSDTGVVSGDVTTVATGRVGLAACEYGGGKAIFGYGSTFSGGTVLRLLTNLVSNTGILASDVNSAGPARTNLAACSFGGDKGIFGYGNASSGNTTATNIVSNTGVVASSTTNSGTARVELAACEYGGDKGVFGYGWVTTSATAVTNRVSNTGVVASNTTGVGTAREGIAACQYGGDKGIFGYGRTSSLQNITNRVANTGVVSSNVTGVGTARTFLAACEYGGDKGIFGYGNADGTSATTYNITNLVSNTGVVSGNTAGVGNARGRLAACSFN
jgi:hypothetical protein